MPERSIAQGICLKSSGPEKRGFPLNLENSCGNGETADHDTLDALRSVKGHINDTARGQGLGWGAWISPNVTFSLCYHFLLSSRPIQATVLQISRQTFAGRQILTLLCFFLKLLELGLPRGRNPKILCRYRSENLQEHCANLRKICV
jgi:hypothetical protein